MTTFIECVNGALINADSITTVRPVSGNGDEILYEVFILGGNGYPAGMAWAYADHNAVVFQKIHKLKESV